MSTPDPLPRDLSLVSLPMLAVMTAQFLSALADNALLIAAIALLKSQSNAALIPWLQESFVVPYILLAPFVGPIADSFAKGHVMFGGNTLKVVGAGAILAGLNPLLGYALVGVGATVYSPAKYGILSQLFTAEKLVRANGMLEGSTIAAILLGAIAGGFLADRSVTLALSCVVGVYLLAAGANLLIPRLPAEHPVALNQPAVLIRDFLGALRDLSRNTDARFSLIGTSAFWGAGTALRLLLFIWVPIALGVVGNQTPSLLMAALSIGIVFGAVAAGIWISVTTVNRALIGGLLLGPLVILLAYSTQMTLAVVLLALVGLCGGIFAVPLNALLQKHGHESIGAGRALAVQNLFENIAILVFVGFYAGMEKAQVAAVPTVAILGGLLFTALAALSIWRLKTRQG